jgi:hypothetical protein
MRSSVTAVKAGGTSDVKILDNDGNCASSWFSEMHDTHAVLHALVLVQDLG